MSAHEAGTRERGGRRGYCWAAALAVAATLAGAQAQAAGQAQREAALKAQLLLKLLRYVEWPAERAPCEARPLRLCLLGAEELAGPLEATRLLGGGGQVYELHVLERRDSRAGVAVAACHAFFAAGLAHDEFEVLARACEQQKTLLVAAQAGAAERGAAINLTNQDGRWRFEVNSQALRRAQLKVAATLVGMATLVGAR